MPVRQNLAEMNLSFVEKKAMRLLEFMTKFPDETSCKEYFSEIRKKEGVVCKKCGNKHHYWLSAKWQFQCSKCNFRTTLRSGIVMENSRLPFRTYFMIMLLMSSTKKGVSANEMARQLGHKRYMTIWAIMHRMRDLMGKRDDLYKLSDMVEFDEGFFETEVSEKQRKNLKRGKGSQRQRNVAVMAESTPLEDIESGTKSSHCRYFKMKVLKSKKSVSVDNLVKEKLLPDSIVFSDKSTTYINISSFIDGHVTEKSSNRVTANTLKWVHIAI